TWREKKKNPFNILFFSLLLLLYIRLFLFSSSFPLLVFFSFFFFSLLPLLCSESLGVRSPCSLVIEKLALNLTRKKRSRKRYLFRVKDRIKPLIPSAVNSPRPAREAVSLQLDPPDVCSVLCRAAPPTTSPSNRRVSCRLDYSAPHSGTRGTLASNLPKQLVDKGGDVDSYFISLLTATPEKSF
ncbi:hypothetical protein TMatcc_001730, partial [Talaromyces marneffei ATCC 18224]